MKNFNDLNLDITGDVNRVGSFTNILGLVVGKTTGTTSSITPSQIAPNSFVTINVPANSCAGWQTGGKIRLHVDANGNNYYEYLNNAAQIETATAIGTISTSGNATIVLTSSVVTGSPKTLSVAVEEDDTPEMWAEKVRSALAADIAITLRFIVTGALNKIILIRKPTTSGKYPLYDINDLTLNLSLANGTCAGITPTNSSENTSAGAGYEDSVSGTITSITSTQIIIRVDAATPTSTPRTAWVVSYRSPTFTSTLDSLLDDFKDDLDQLENMSL